MGSRSIHRTEAGARAVASLYEATLARWPVHYESILVTTRHGDTHVIACGPVAAPPLALLHGAGANSDMWLRDVAHFRVAYRVLLSERRRFLAESMSMTSEDAILPRETDSGSQTNPEARRKTGLLFSGVSHAAQPPVLQEEKASCRSCGSCGERASHSTTCCPCGTSGAKMRRLGALWGESGQRADDRMNRALNSDGCAAGSLVSASWFPTQMPR